MIWWLGRVGVQAATRDDDGYGPTYPDEEEADEDEECGQAEGEDPRLRVPAEVGCSLLEERVHVSVEEGQVVLRADVLHLGRRRDATLGGRTITTTTSTRSLTETGFHRDRASAACLD